MKILVSIVATLLGVPVLADDIRLPARTPAAYKTECGSCHVAYPPALLGRGNWKKIMTGLDRHFGSDASLDDKTRAGIEKFLGDNAGRRSGASSAAEPRITTTHWFQREHREVPDTVWKDARVKSPANCSACHKGAEQGRYGERELQVPGMGRHREKDD